MFNVCICKKQVISYKNVTKKLQNTKKTSVINVLSLMRLERMGVLFIKEKKVTMKDHIFFIGSGGECCDTGSIMCLCWRLPVST